MLSEIPSTGNPVGQVEVKIGPQFLNLFSEHLYSSPNKAFEELVSNSWDAGAETVHIWVPNDLGGDDAAIWVLDDGSSMDMEGFRSLWSVATSSKRATETIGSRRPIGKFGVGKLATYLLAHELTYVCRAVDGIVRAVTMDYRRIDNHDKNALHIEPLPLQVRELDSDQLSSLLSGLPNATLLSNLIRNDVAGQSPEATFDDEFGGEDAPPLRAAGTWTLAILSSLKLPGKKLQTGWIRRLLRTSLPLGNSITIYFNEELLSSAKSSTKVVREWVLGPGFDLQTLSLPNDEEIAIEVKPVPYPHINVGELGSVSGTVKLYADRISGGKSDTIDVSNGFFVNIRGRVLKPEDPYFGLTNLSHSVWAKFRATIRADGLDDALAVNREALVESRKLVIMRALLMRLFNRARAEHDSAAAASWPDAGEVLTEKWGVVPFQPLERVIRDAMASDSYAPDFITLPSKEERASAALEWGEEIETSAADLIKDVVVEELGTEAKLVKYDVATRRVVVNRNHPFSQEHGETIEELRLLRDTALVDLLTDAFMADMGIPEEQLAEIRNYKDRAFRLVAQVRRRSATQIASLLMSTTAHAKGFERIIGDALEHIGFSVQRLGQSGQPEGVATAVVSPGMGDARAAYKFTYDAKSSGSGRSTTHNVGVAGLARHRRDHGADHTLVVAPGFSAGALEKECADAAVTPMLAQDLARLVMLTVGYGPLSLTEFRRVFELHSPPAVSDWVQKLVRAHASKKHLSLGILIQSLTTLTAGNPDRPDMIHCSLIAEHCRTLLCDSTYPTRNDVAAAVRGLSLMVPNVITIAPTSQDVFLNAAPSKLREAIVKQLNTIPDDLRYGIAR